MAQTFLHQVTFTVLTCGECHTQFAMTDEMYRRQVSDKRTFYCPNGHPRAFVGESDKDRAQRLAGALDMERTRRAETERQLDYQRRARKGVSTRLQKTKARVGRGVCPCCNRSFSALAAHMASEHPGYASSEEQTDV